MLAQYIYMEHNRLWLPVTVLRFKCSNTHNNAFSFTLKMRGKHFIIPLIKKSSLVQLRPQVKTVLTNLNNKLLIINSNYIFSIIMLAKMFKLTPQVCVKPDDDEALQNDLRRTSDPMVITFD